MNREDVIRMAREQGLPETETEGVFRVNTDDLGRMLAAEREKVAAWMMERGYATGHGDSTENLLQELDWQIKEKQEPVTFVCSTGLCRLTLTQTDVGIGDVQAIRARGER